MMNKKETKNKASSLKKEFFPILQRKNYLMLIDSILIVSGYYLTYLAILPRYLLGETFHSFKYSFLIVLVIYLFAYIFGGIYSKIWRYADAKEYRACMAYSLLAGGVFIVIAGTSQYHVPLRIQVISPFVIGVLIITSRIMYKIIRQDRSLRVEKESRKKKEIRKRLAIIGAGNSGALLYREMKENPYIKYDIIFFMDDNMDKIGRKLYDIPIYGPIDHIAKASEKHLIEEIIIAMPSITGKERKRIVELATESKADVKILPSMAFALAEKASLEGRQTDLMGKLRDIEVEDLLGRDPIRVDDADISTYIKGRNVLVSGGGGSIGSELCRQVISYGAKKLIILDNHENGAYEIEQELIRDYGYRPQVEIIDVKDKQRLNRLFEDEKSQGSAIEIVFHAAAHKHVPLMEHNPEAAIKNNIIGTHNIADLCKDHKIMRMILISTDKAVNPTNVMGATKRACELVVQAMNQKSLETIFTAVRFGNVLGSNGSVIPLFKKQIEKGGPITVTHPEIIRYFMTIPEAVSLVLNAGGLAQGGEIFVLDMGDPVKIVDLAKKLITLSGLELDVDINIKYTGLRPGEKLYEELLMEEEGLKTTKSEKIFIGKSLEVEPEEIFNQLTDFKETQRDREALKAWLKGLVITYKEVEYND